LRQTLFSEPRLVVECLKSRIENIFRTGLRAFSAEGAFMMCEIDFCQSAGPEDDDADGAGIDALPAAAAGLKDGIMPRPGRS
jgi:hypothetical protein